MKNKILISIMVLISIITLTGCSLPSNLDDIIGTGGEQNTELESEVLLETNDNQIALNYYGQYTIVFKHDGDKITGKEEVYIFDNAEAASYGMIAIKVTAQVVENVESVKQKGKYVVIKYKEAEYADLTLEDVKNNYATLEDMKKIISENKNNDNVNTPDDGENEPETNELYDVTELVNVSIPSYAKKGVATKAFCDKINSSAPYQEGWNLFLKNVTIDDYNKYTQNLKDNGGAADTSSADNTLSITFDWGNINGTYYPDKLTFDINIMVN